MKGKIRFEAGFLALAISFSALAPGFLTKKAYAAEEGDYYEDVLEEDENYIDIDLLNSQYDLGLSEDEKVLEAQALQGAIIVDNKARDIPLMKQAEEKLAALAEDRCIDLPAQLKNPNPQQFFYIGSIGLRIKLLIKVGEFINHMSTDQVYKIQEAHNIAGQTAFEAVMVALSPFNGRRQVLDALDKVDTTYLRLCQYRDLTSSDTATVYVKRIFNKNMSKARAMSSRYFDDKKNTYGVRGKEKYVQDLLRSELDGIQRESAQKITFGELLELDARLKSASSSALLSEEMIANPTRKADVVQSEINSQNRCKARARSQISNEEYKEWNEYVSKLTITKNKANVTYDEVMSSVYDLRDFDMALQDKYPDLSVREESSSQFNPQKGSGYSMYVPSAYIEPSQVAQIDWLMSPTFDKIPSGYRQGSSSNIIVGFKSQMAVYGGYNSYTANRASIRNEMVTTDVTGTDSDLVMPDFNSFNY